MRVAALILGLIGSLGGLISSYLVANVISIARSWTQATGVNFTENWGLVGITDPGTVEALGWITMICFVVSVVGAAFALSRPKIAGWAMIIPAAVVFLFGIVNVTIGISSVFLILAGIFSLIEAKQEIGKAETEENEEAYTEDTSLKSLLKEWWQAGKKE